MKKEKCYTCNKEIDIKKELGFRTTKGLKYACEKHIQFYKM